MSPLRQVESGVGTTNAGTSNSNNAAAWGGNAVITYGNDDLVTTGESVRFLYNNNNNGTSTGMVNVRGNDNTIFLVDDGDAVTVYTGINNLPDITVKDGANDRVYVSYLIEKDEAGGTNAALVYIYADEDEADIDGGSATDLLFILNRSERKVDRANGDVIEVWNAVLNGDVTTIEAKETTGFKPYTMYYKLSQDSNGYYDGEEFEQGSDRRLGTMLMANNDVVDYSSGTLALGGETYAVNSDTQIVLILNDTLDNGAPGGDKDRTNNLGALTDDNSVIVMRNTAADHEVYSVSAQSLENYLRDRDVDAEFYGVADGTDSDLLETLYVVVTNVSLLSGENRRPNT